MAGFAIKHSVVEEKSATSSPTGCSIAVNFKQGAGRDMMLGAAFRTGVLSAPFRSAQSPLPPQLDWVSCGSGLSS
jgi:hypothetical protein